MARIVLADRDLAYDGTWPDDRAPDDAALALVRLAEALASRGHRVSAFTRSAKAFSARGVSWEPLSKGVPAEADLFVANRHHRLLKLARKARRTAIWLHRPGLSLLRWGPLTAFARRRPAMVFLGVYHAASYPGWGPGGPRAIIPLATEAVFRTAGAALRPPPPFAMWAGGSAASLDWTLDLWSREVFPAVPKARLYVFADKKLARGIERARAMKGEGVEVRAPVGPDERASELAQTRVFLHPGDADDMFCMAAAEAQAMGVPAVVCDVAAMRERVVDRETGFVVPAGDVAGFVSAAVRLLNDDALWREQRDAALRYNRARGWDDVAADFEELRK
ncbi:MAG TPA: glycosyltransferase [Alphaproteobacteria bacterium]|nr:glycosyltransferase [Alphaproteobacteria bacterium]